jgi:hypothetical protein
MDPLSYTQFSLSPPIVDLAVSADWEFDRSFVRLLEEESLRRGLGFLAIWPENLAEVLEGLRNRQWHPRFFIDRASDTAPEFVELNRLLVKLGTPLLDSIEALRWAANKATMHLECIAHGLNTPYTFIIPPYRTAEHVYLSIEDIARLGRPFIIKPANTTGGGIGVVDGAETLQDVLSTRQEYAHDLYLLQEKIFPMQIDDKRFWFRCFYACGLVEFTWWNDLTHRYKETTPDDIARYGLEPMIDVMRTIAEVSRLHFFSTEIARDKAGRFVVIDYVNEICDMRLQSEHPDGVPDPLAGRIAVSLVDYSQSHGFSIPSGQTEATGNP